ncbi:MAG: hypothetical protein K9I94_05565 [Bacteroidales bacterium]|nr:hypothetical protein [Bacteroidales bacterium]
MLAPMLRILALYKVLPRKKSQEFNGNLIDGPEVYSVGYGAKFQIKPGVVTRELEALFKQAGELLNNRLDQLMNILVNRDQNFYHDYLKARVIVDYQEEVVAFAGCVVRMCGFELENVNKRYWFYIDTSRNT